jgi:hypothetical protein
MKRRNHLQAEKEEAHNQQQEHSPTNRSHRKRFNPAFVHRKQHSRKETKRLLRLEMSTRSTHIQADKSTDREENKPETVAHKASANPIDSIAFQDKKYKPERRNPVRQLLKALMNHTFGKVVTSLKNERKQEIISEDKEQKRHNNLLQTLPPETIKPTFPVRLLQTVTAQNQEHSHEKPPTHVKHRRYLIVQQDVEHKNGNGSKALQCQGIRSREHFHGHKQTFKVQRYTFYIKQQKEASKKRQSQSASAILVN